MRSMAVLFVLLAVSVPAAAQRPPLDTLYTHADTDGTTLSYRWSNVVTGFDMPIRVEVPGSGTHLLKPTEEWQTLTVAPAGAAPTVDENYYVTVKGQ